MSSISWQKNIAFIFFTSLASYLVMAMVYPDLLIHHKIVLSNQHDTEVPLLNTFSLISNYYQGGIQLWNRFDQMTYAYFHLGTGFYTTSNILTAAVYIFLSPFFEYPGEALQSIHSIVFHAFNILLRTAGGYLLLRRLCSNKLLIFISLIYLNTLLSIPMYLGLLTNNLYSLFPLLAYFMMRFFEGFKLNDFLGGTLTMTLGVATSPLMALGYFYQAVHFLLLAGLIWAWFMAKEPSIKNIFMYLKIGATAKNVFKTGVVCAICLAIMLPFLQMERSLKDDFFIPEAFEEKAGGRMTGKHSISKYFSKPTGPHLKPKDFPLQSVDSQQNIYFFDWWFIGFSTMLFSGAGFLLSKDRRKHLFFWPIIFLILVMLPRDQFSLLSIGHWVNVLTNPFQYLVRGFGMTGFLIPYFFLPLIVLGLQAFKDMVFYNNVKSVHFQRVPIGAGLLVSILTYWSFCLSENGSFLEVGIKISLFAGALILLLLWTLWKDKKIYFLSKVAKHRSAITISVISTLLIIDLILLTVYTSKNQYSNVRIFEGIVSGLADQGLVVPVFQNPQIMPFQEYYSPYEKELFSQNPKANKRYKITDSQIHADGIFQDPEAISISRLNSRMGPYGLFYHFTHLGRFFFSPSVYHPRHMTYKGLDTDSETQDYLNQDQRLIFMAKKAINSNRLNRIRNERNNASFLADLINSRDIVSIATDEKSFPYPFQSNKSDVTQNSRNTSVPIRTSKFSFLLSKANQQDLNSFKEYTFHLPEKFPSYTATNLFTKDQENLNAWIGNKRLDPAQGKLIRPFTFDVQNVQTGKLTILLPKNYNIQGKSAELILNSSSEILNIWLNEQDNIGLDYNAPENGWLVFHFPFDERWKITVDNKPAKFYRANKYFIGSPIEKGQHKVLVQYWPDTFLREMIAVSIILSVLLNLSLVILGIRQENSALNSLVS
jgi:hypothetical protein